MRKREITGKKEFMRRRLNMRGRERNRGEVAGYESGAGRKGLREVKRA
jgi:hypothetical protein